MVPERHLIKPGLSGPDRLVRVTSCRSTDRLQNVPTQSPVDCQPILVDRVAQQGLTSGFGKRCSLSASLTGCGLLTRDEVLDQLRTGTGGLFHVDDLADARCIKLEFVHAWFDR